MLARTVIPANLARKMDETRTFCRTCVGGQIGSDGGWHAFTRLGHAAAAQAPRTTFEHDAACQTQDVSGTFKGNLRMRNRAAGLHARRCSACVHTAVICFASHATRRRRFIIHPNTATRAARAMCGHPQLPCAAGVWAIRNLPGSLARKPLNSWRGAAKFFYDV